LRLDQCLTDPARQKPARRDHAVILRSALDRDEAPVSLRGCLLQHVSLPSGPHLTIAMTCSPPPRPVAVRRPSKRHEFLTTEKSVQLPELKRSGEVFLLDLGGGESRITPDFSDALVGCVKTIEAHPAPRAVVTVASGNYFSTGLDLDWAAANPHELGRLVEGFHEALAALLSCNAYTVAAIQGHCFGGGALLALAHDSMIMRDDRGYFCLPEIDLPVPFTDGMMALIAAKLDPSTASAAVLTGRKFTGEEAAIARFSHPPVAGDLLLEEAKAIATRQASKDPQTLGTMKRRLFSEALERLAHLGADLPQALPKYPQAPV
jgi:enoyl-CoA hydratase/carnithine racemase